MPKFCIVDQKRESAVIVEGVFIVEWLNRYYLYSFICPKEIVVLGCYQTKERAKKVLEEIVNSRCFFSNEPYIMPMR